MSWYALPLVRSAPGTLCLVPLGYEKQTIGILTFTVIFTLALSFTLAGVLCPPRWAFPKQFIVGVLNAVLSVSALFGVYGGVISAERMLWEVGFKSHCARPSRRAEAFCLQS